MSKSSRAEGGDVTPAVRAWAEANVIRNALRRLGESESYIAPLVAQVEKDHFAAVDAAVAEAEAREREACAALFDDPEACYGMIPKHFAAAIRQRGTKC